MDELELLVAEANAEGLVTEVIRPAAIVPEEVARQVLAEMAFRDPRLGGCWETDPSTWRRWDRPFDGTDGGRGAAQLLGTIHVAYGTPTRYDITIYRVSVTREGTAHGYTVASLCEEALAFGGVALADCPRADLKAPPRPFHFPAQD